MTNASQPKEPPAEESKATASAPSHTRTYNIKVYNNKGRKLAAQKISTVEDAQTELQRLIDNQVKAGRKVNVTEAHIDNGKPMAFTVDEGTAKKPFINEYRIL